MKALAALLIISAPIHIITGYPTGVPLIWKTIYFTVAFLQVRYGLGIIIQLAREKQ